MKIPLSNDKIHLIAVPMPTVSPFKNYDAWYSEITHYGVCLGVDEAAKWLNENLRLFGVIAVNDMAYVIIGHMLCNSAIKGSWQELYLVKEKVFNSSINRREYIDTYKEIL